MGVQIEIQSVFSMIYLVWIHQLPCPKPLTPPVYLPLLSLLLPDALHTYGCGELMNLALYLVSGETTVHF